MEAVFYRLSVKSLVLAPAYGTERAELYKGPQCLPCPPSFKKTGKPNKFVIGMQRPSPRSFWKIPYLNRGIAPVESEDPEVAPLIARCVKELL